MSDPVNHPSHYTFAIEVIDALEAWNLPFQLANVVKYVARAGRKDPTKLLEDLRKAKWYLDRYIALVERDQASAQQTREARNVAAGHLPDCIGPGPSCRALCGRDGK